jgi:hypothetical protein
VVVLFDLGKVNPGALRGARLVMRGGEMNCVLGERVLVAHESRVLGTVAVFEHDAKRRACHLRGIAERVLVFSDSDSAAPAPGAGVLLRSVASAASALPHVRLRDTLANRSAPLALAEAPAPAPAGAPAQAAASQQATNEANTGQAMAEARPQEEREVLGRGDGGTSGGDLGASFPSSFRPLLPYSELSQYRLT